MMKKINKDAVFPLAALVMLVFALSRQMFMVPPLGKLLDPFIGAVQNEDEGRLNAAALSIPGKELKAPVQVYFDKRKVPHIYAQNNSDLYFAQGYVTASLRLWQMDFMTYASAGRLAEIFSQKDFFDYDRNQRRIGILEAAKQSLKVINANPLTKEALTAYTKGVNAYIHQLSYREIPLEYKMLGYEPEPWTELKSVLILKSMANNMTGYEEDLFMSKMILALGEENFNKLYPDYYENSTPVMNANKPALFAAAAPLKVPSYLDYSFLSSNSVIAESPYNPRLGSNSWAVSGKRTKSGFPILANDPHLGLSLPNIWIEMQLTAPGMNVYGVSIPGAPAIIIGFNEKVAWGITNGSDDVRDWYKLKITNDYKQYELDGQWRNLAYRVEEIKRRGEAPFYDTVYSSVHGPIVNNRSFPGKDPDMMDMALRWELHRPSNEFYTFIKLNTAADYNDYKAAIRNYSTPLQNFTYAGKDNIIAINHQGSMPVKWAGQGKFILDGTRSAHLYTKYIPVDSLPQRYNPECNYVQSANQHPTYDNYPYYYNGYYSETRANRIEQLLSKSDKLDIAGMEAIQLDNTNSFSAEALPVLLSKINRSRLNPQQQKDLDAVSKWKGNYDFKDKIARLYEIWWANTVFYTWDEFKNYRFYLRPPDKVVLLDLIRKEPDNKYFDLQSTAQQENASDIITDAFITSSNDFTKTRKEGREQWGDYHKVNLMHPTNLPAFSEMSLSAAGQSEAINATSRNWGPSWRMIVELGDRPKAYGIYPGGQSGNPASEYYNNFTKDWNKGKYYPLLFFMNSAEAKAQASSTWTFNTAK